MSKSVLIIVIIVAGLVAFATIVSLILNSKENNNLIYIKKMQGRKFANEATFYERFVKRLIDIVVGFIGMIISIPFVFVASLFVFFEDPGNVFFTQKRVGINNTFFIIHKLRTMKQNLEDIPTHMFSKEDQEKYILKVGYFIRKASIDELPQFIDIFRGRMSLIGPRPALWNQDDLIAEREKNGSITVRPGLTGWAQINGRDSISIEEKAALDGEYKDVMRKSSFSGFKMDLKCFFGTIKSLFTSEGFVEGGTGSMEEKNEGSK